MRSAAEAPSSWRFPARSASPAVRFTWLILSWAKIFRFGGSLYWVGSERSCEEISLPWVRGSLGGNFY